MSAALMTSATETLSTPNSRTRRAAHSTILCRFFCACSCDERPIIVVPFRTRSRFVTVCRRRQFKKPPPCKQSGLVTIDYIHYLYFGRLRRPGSTKEHIMTTTYDPKITALLCIDFYNDFLSEGGKLWPWVKDMANEVNLLDNLRTILRTARDAGIKIYHVLHHRWESCDYVNWKYPSPYQLGAGERQAFAKGTWAGTFHDHFQVQEGYIVV